MAGPSVRENTSRFDTVLPNSLMRRIENAAASLGLTKRAALLIILNEGCFAIERITPDGKQATDNAE